MPPFRVLPDVLDEAAVAALLAHAASCEADFKPTAVKGGRVDPATRRSLGLRSLDPFRPLFEECVLARSAELLAAIGMVRETSLKLELQLVAHGDGAFYRPHLDTQTGADPKSIRILSGVYYFHRMPKGFDGGALRLYAFGDKARFIDIEPTHNTLLIFPSWALHEVRPVSCPSGAFMDSRFAINCWLRRPRAPKAPEPA